MLCYIIEEVLPRDYYTTMVSLTADINLLVLLLHELEPRVVNHLKSVDFELPMVFVEQMITIFTANRADLTDVIMDAFLIDGSRVYFKVILLFFRYFREELLQLREFGRPR